MVLITGASGFLGQHLVRYLSAHGVKARALYNNNPPPVHLKNSPGIEWVKCDLLDIFEVEEVMAGITDVYHCAAIISFNKNQREQMLHFNPESTANIVNQSLEQSIRKLVYVSSVAALGRNGNPNKEITEEEEWGESNYNSAYAISKYLAETEVWRGIGEGLNAVIVNPGIILGEGDWNKGSSQLMKVANSEFPFYTNGITSWVDVEDVVKALVMLMDSDYEAERYIISAGNYPFKQIFTFMASGLRKKPPRYYANSLITGMAWRLGSLYSYLTGKQATITKETAKNAGAFARYDNTKFLAAFPGFSYKPIEETIQNMASKFSIQTQ